MKRPREEAGAEEGEAAAEVGEAGGAERNGAPADDAAAAAAAVKDEEDEEDELPVVRRPGGPAVRKGADCPYLDTISRHNLDFDFEKCCSVSLSPVNVYACLVCGKYFQVAGNLSLTPTAPAPSSEQRPRGAASGLPGGLGRPAASALTRPPPACPAPPRRAGPWAQDTCLHACAGGTASHLHEAGRRQGAG